MAITATWRRALAVLLAVCVAIAFVPAFHGTAQAATVKKAGMYCTFDNAISISKSKLVVKAKKQKIRYFKNSSVSYDRAKALKKGTYVFKLTSKTNFFTASPEGENLISRSKAAKIASQLTTYIYVQGGKVTKVIISA